MASRAKGHVFEERFLGLDGLQLVVAYRQAVKEEKEEMQLIKTIHHNWTDRFNNSVKALLLFSNPTYYKALEDMKDMEKHKADVKVEEFPQLWDDLMKVIPHEVKIEEPTSNPLASIPFIPELDEVITGFVSYKRKKEVTDHGNE